MTEDQNYFFNDSKFKTILKNKEMKEKHYNLTTSSGAISSIIFFPDAKIPKSFEKIILNSLLSFDNLSKNNNFIEFFNKFFKVTIDSSFKLINRIKMISYSLHSVSFSKVYSTRQSSLPR